MSSKETKGQKLTRIRSFQITNELGLHARAAARIVELADQHRARLYLGKDGREVDGSSILSILTLSCPRGTQIEARIVGEDADRFMERLGELFENRFGERK